MNKVIVGSTASGGRTQLLATIETGGGLNARFCGAETAI
jgi:hypothetical protein